MPINFLDIETTASSAEAGIVVAIGILQEKAEKPKILFADGPRQEPRIIKQALQILKGSTVITWKGSRFDIPFLTARALANGIALEPLITLRHIDLAEIASRNLLLKDNSSWTLLRFLGYERRDRIYGGEVPPRYLEVLSRDGKGTRAKREIVEHLLADLKALKFLYGKLKPMIPE